MLLSSLDIAMDQGLRFMNSDELLDDFKQFIANGGPRPEDYQTFHALMDALAVCLQYNELSHEKWQNLLRKCRFLNDADSVIGHCKLRPYGYPGDFSLLDKIDTCHRSDKHRIWDDYAQSLPIAVALRERKEYFKSLLEGNLALSGDVLDIASGSGRGLWKYFSENPKSRVEVTSVEMEEKAISHASELNKRYLDRINFVPMNIFRYETIQTYHLIWSAHLFEYLNDNAFVTLLEKCVKWLKPDGELVLCVFSDDCHQHGRSFWELLGGWHCIYRSEEALIDLAVAAGFRKKNAVVQKWNGGLNQYLRLKI